MVKPVLLALVVLGGVAVAASTIVTPARRSRFSRMPEAMMRRCLEHMPEDLPPKAITSGVRQIQQQNDEILALLREQKELLRHPAGAR
jgi:hypothetical protein